MCKKNKEISKTNLENDNQEEKKEYKQGSPLLESQNNALKKILKKLTNEKGNNLI